LTRKTLQQYREELTVVLVALMDEYEAVTADIHAGYAVWAMQRDLLLAQHETDIALSKFRDKEHS
jgi:hypothetical protein